MSQLQRIPGITPIGSPGQYAPKPQGVTPIGSPGQYAPRPGGIGIAPSEPDAPKPQGVKPIGAPGQYAPSSATPGYQTADAATTVSIKGMLGNTPPEAPKVPAPASAQVGVQHAPRADSPVQAPVAKPAPVAVAATPGTAPSIGVSTPAGASADQLNAAYDAAGYGPNVSPARPTPAVAQAKPAQAQGKPAAAPAPQNPTVARGIGVQSRSSSVSSPFAGSGESYGEDMRETLQRQFADAAWHADHNGKQLIAHEDGGYHWDSSNHDGYVHQQMQAANMLNQLDQTAGDIRNKDPRTAVEASIGGLSTPQGRALAEGQNQMPPGSIPAPGGFSYNPTNVGPGDRVDRNVQGLHNILHGDLPLHEKVAAASLIPGIGAPGSPHQELFDAWMARQQASGDKWAHDVNQYGNTGQTANNGLSDHGWLGSLFGDPKASQAGPVQARNQKFHADMGRLGYKFHPQ